MLTLKTDASRSGPKLLLVMVAALVLVVLLESTSLGQRPKRGGGSQMVVMETWQFKAACVGLAFLISGFISFFFFFPMMLNQRNPVWPLDAYGRCLWLTCTITFWLGAWLFRAYLIDEAGKSTIAIYWRGLVAVGVWIVVLLILGSVFYSNRGRVSAAT